MEDLDVLIERAEFLACRDDETTSDDGLDQDLDRTPRWDSDVTLEAQQSLCTEMSSYISCLMELVPTLEEALATTKDYHDMKQEVPAAILQVSGPAQPFILLIHDKFRRAELSLVRRLGEANWVRSGRMRNSPAASTCFHDESGELPEVLRRNYPAASVAPNSLLASESIFHDSGLGTSIPAKSQYAASFASPLSQETGGSAKVPPTPKEVFAGEPFRCQLCQNTLLAVKSRADWKYACSV